jgi:CRISPR-associated protein Cmr3
MHWWPGPEQFPVCPEAIRASIVKHNACRVVLLTPACFAQGWYPTSLLQQHNGVQPTLKAIAVQRAQVISGWDLAANHGKGAPKPTRRLAPAGTVLFLKLDGRNEAINQWIDDHWMACVSDAAQDRRDGFGLAVLGTWTGNLQVMGETNA